MTDRSQPARAKPGDVGDVASKTSGVTGRPGGPLQILLVFVGFQILAVVLVVAAEMVPDRLVADSLLEGIDRGWVSTDHFPRTGLDNVVDRWSECNVLTMGLGDPPTSNNIETAITSPQLGWCEKAVPRLLAYRDGERLESFDDYYRYWHGYTIVTRPGLALLGVAGTRMLAMALVVTAIASAAVTIARTTSTPAAIALVAPLLLTSDLMDIGQSLGHALITATCWGAVLLTWVVLHRRPDLISIATLGVLAGSVAAFVELMVLISGTLAMFSIIAVVSMWTHGWRGRKLFAAGSTAASSWFLGFALTWATKWLLAGFVIGFPHVLNSVKGMIGFRIGGENEGVTDAFGAAAGLNVAFWIDRPLGFLVPLALLAALFLAVRGWLRDRLQPGYLLLLAGLTVIPLVWFEVLSNHSQIHPWIVYRSLPLALGAFLFALVVANTPQPDS